MNDAIIKLAESLLAVGKLEFSVDLDVNYNTFTRKQKIATIEGITEELKGLGVGDKLRIRSFATYPALYGGNNSLHVSVEMV